MKEDFCLETLLRGCRVDEGKWHSGRSRKREESQMVNIRMAIAFYIVSDFSYRAFFWTVILVDWDYMVPPHNCSFFAGCLCLNTVSAGVKLGEE